MQTVRCLITVVFINVLLYKECSTFNDEDLVVQLTDPPSKIRGHILQSDQGLDYFAFQEIPYAEPPVGERRFKISKRHPGWNGILNTTDNTRVCPQTIPTLLPMNENCLHINVYTPVIPSSDQKLAVYAWIHGGGHMFWDNSVYRYGPKYLMDYNIVVVTFSYRLGALGYLGTDDGVIPLNLAFWDQNLALQWIQDNIHIFGGDPKKVTIGGESTGATSVSLHILSNASKGLFRGAIQQSGTAMNTHNYQKFNDHYAFELGRLLNTSLAYGDTTALLDILQKANVSDILEAQTQVVNLAPRISVIPDLIWAVSLEKSVKKNEAFLWKPMHQSFIDGDFNKVPMLLGYDYLEMIWFLSTPTRPSIFNVGLDIVNETTTYLDEDSSRLINDKLNILDKDKAIVGTMLKDLYTNDTFTSDLEAYIHFASDIYFNFAPIRQADLGSKYLRKIYLYEFAYSPETNKPIAQGAEHTEELPYFWHNVEDKPDINEFQKVLRHRLLKLWTNFIKYLNPTPSYDEDFDNTLWPKFSSKNLSYLYINETLEIRSNPRNYFQVRQIMEKYMKSPKIVF